MAAKSAAKSKETLVSAAQASAVEASAAGTSETSAQKTAEKKAPAAQGSAKTTSTKKASAKAASAKTSSAKKSTKKAATKVTAAQKEQARKARAGARIAGENSKETGQSVTAQPAAPQAQSALATTAEPSEFVSDKDDSAAADGGGSFLAANYTTGDIWVPNAAIPAIDEATYHAQKTQAEGQRRAIEVASLNLQNINGLHELERQNVEVAISAKTTETRAAQLTGVEIDYQRQVEHNGEKSEQLMQASAKREAATRETGYTQQLIALKDQNFELEIQQAQTVFAEKAARYRAQLTGQ